MYYEGYDRIGGRNMSSTTTTSRIALPVGMAWKCSKCGTANDTNGVINIEYSSIAAGRATSNIHDKLKSEWKEKALGIITNPKDYADDLRAWLYIGDGKCKKCQNKETWTRKTKLGLYYIFTIASFFSGIAAVCDIIAIFRGEPYSIPVLLVFAACIIPLILMTVGERSFSKKIRPIPDECMPHIICWDRDLNEYAMSKNQLIYSKTTVEAFNDSLGYPLEIPEGIPSYLDTLDTIENDHIGICITVDPVFLEKNYNTEKASAKNDAVMFCHKCGERLKDGSDFCSYCGTRIN